MALILLNLRPEPEPGDPGEAIVDAAPAEEISNSPAGPVTEGVLEIVNPFEALVEEPRAAVALLVLFGIVVLAAITLGGLWSAVQEALSGGGQPHGLGLK